MLQIRRASIFCYRFQVWDAERNLCKLVKSHIDKNVPPIVQPVRRLAFSLQEKLDQELDKLLDLDIIEEAKDNLTQWTSPLVAVPKKNVEKFVFVSICVELMKRYEGNGTHFQLVRKSCTK